MNSLQGNKTTLKSYLLDTFYKGILIFTELALFFFLGRKNYSMKGLDNICTESSIWAMSHDYVALDSILMFYLTKKMGLKNVFVVITPGFNKGIFVPGLHFIPRKRDTSNNIIKALENGNVVVIFYTRDQLQYFNLDYIVNKCKQKISLIPISIVCPSLKSISHNVSIIKQLILCFRKKFISFCGSG